jgi:hypothetical protein
MTAGEQDETYVTLSAAANHPHSNCQRIFNHLARLSLPRSLIASRASETIPLHSCSERPAEVAKEKFITVLITCHLFYLNAWQLLPTLVGR